MGRQLTQQEIDAVFQNVKGKGEDPTKKAVVFDFRRPDRIAKSQVRAIHMLHENFVRNLASSLYRCRRDLLPWRGAMGCAGCGLRSEHASRCWRW